MAGSVLFLRINPTYRCNKDCKHCFIKLRNRDETNIDMSKDVMDKTFEAYKRTVETHGISRFTTVQFLGGEPTLVPDKIKYIINRFREIPETKKFDNYGFQIFTNGVEIDPIFYNWCRENKVKFCLSLNDLLIDEYEEKLKTFVELGVKFHTFFALTKDVLLNLKDFFSVAYKYTDDLRIHHEWNGNEETRNLFHEKTPEGIQWCLDNDLIFKTEYLYNSMSLMWANTNKFYHTCGRSYAMVDPDGTVNCCINIYNPIGNVKEKDFEFIKKIKLSNPLQFHFKGIDECEKCEFKLICGGGCPADKRRLYNRLDIPDMYCKTHKKIIPLMIEMERKYKEKHNVKI